MYKHWKQVNIIIDEILELEPGSRISLLEKTLGDKPEILAEAKDYLQSIEEAETAHFLNDTSLPGSALFQRLSSDISGEAHLRQIVGKRIGPYEIKHLLGEGGMGSVYYAERVDGEFSRKVAIKFLKNGFFSLYLRERFDLEKQLLSKLNHPNITRLMDGGITEEGAPYLIMEFIEGVPIDTYCRNQNLRLKERLSFFLQICRAVQHAHSKLIIHRDLKPANIFVTPDGQTKIMDLVLGSHSARMISGIPVT